MSCEEGEAEESDVAGCIDVVLTFEELRSWAESENIRKDQLKTGEMDDLAASYARLFPIEGGLAKSASMSPDLLRQDFAAISGSEEVGEMLANLKDGSTIHLFEALYCAAGCINGPCFGTGRDIYHRRNRMLQHEKRAQKRASESDIQEAMVGVELHRTINPRPVQLEHHDEAAIRKVLETTGKHSPEDELNCGACGYPTCRENAVAVLSGMAEHSMCIPWMRSVAERKADQIIDNSRTVSCLSTRISVLSLSIRRLLRSSPQHPRLSASRFLR